ncbi:MAG: hypothetical protein JXB14_04800 [Candidatus Altiarchaeota archaeon]|nr:hypothetical protein [Candidatus Altiarchaeota archaeon]
MIKTKKGRLLNPKIAYRKGDKIKTHKTYNSLRELQERRVERLGSEFDRFYLDFVNYLAASRYAPTNDRSVKKTRSGLLRKLNEIGKKTERALELESHLVLRRGTVEEHVARSRRHWLKDTAFAIRDLRKEIE